jgi:hypothetical protein
MRCAAPGSFMRFVTLSQTNMSPLKSNGLEHLVGGERLRGGRSGCRSDGSKKCPGGVWQKMSSRARHPTKSSPRLSENLLGMRQPAPVGRQYPPNWAINSNDRLRIVRSQFHLDDMAAPSTVVEISASLAHSTCSTKRCEFSDQR